MQQQQSEGNAFGLKLMFYMLATAGLPWSGCMAKPGTRGRRLAAGVPGVLGYGGAFLWAAMSRSDLMWLLFCASLLAWMVHAAKPGDGHSRALGDPPAPLEKLAGSWTGGWVLVNISALAFGGILLEVERPAGQWLLVSGAAALASLLFLSVREAAITADQKDAMLESLNRSPR